MRTRRKHWAPLGIAWLGLLVAPGVAGAQVKADDDPEKVSNDSPSRPLQMPAASSEVKEAFDDFDRFNRRGAWERATKALDSIPEAQAGRFLDGPDGFIIPVARKRRAALAGLAPEGLAAYRLFHDADAKKQLDAAEGPTEQATLERLFSAFFLTSSGDDAADRLGDLYFEQGRFDRAADCWLAVYRERPDSDLPPAALALKALIALRRAGRAGEARDLRRELDDRFAAEVVTVAGRKAKVADHLRALAGPAEPERAGSAAATAALGPPPLVAPVPAAWQVRFGASVVAGMTPLERAQWDENALSLAVPRVAVDGGTLFANYFGSVFAVDLATGKLLWRSGSFHNVDIAANGDQARMIDAGRFAVVAGLGHVFDLGRDIKDANYMAVTQLTARRAENGEVAWRTANQPDFAGLDLVGRPILAGDALLVAAKSAGNNNGQEQQSRQLILAVRPHDGKLLWKAEIGAFREAQQYYYYGMPDNAAKPSLIAHAGSVYVDTHAGVLVRLDAKSGRVDWGYGYRTEPTQGQSRFFFRMPTQGPTTPGAPPLPVDDGLLIKGAKSDRVAVIDPDRMKLAWDRPIGRASRLLGVDADSVYLGGPDLSAFDRKTKVLKWSLPLPGGSEDGRVILRADGLWQLTPRGIFEVDPQVGRVRRIFRGDTGDVGDAAGDLILTDRWLLAVGNRAIAAYPRGQAEGADRADGAGPGQLKTRGSE